MDKELVEMLKGLEVVDSYWKDSGFGILFDDGIVLTISFDGGNYMFMQGTDWENFWREQSA